MTYEISHNKLQNCNEFNLQTTTYFETTWKFRSEMYILKYNVCEIWGSHSSVQTDWGLFWPLHLHFFGSKPQRRNIALKSHAKANERSDKKGLKSSFTNFKKKQKMYLQMPQAGIISAPK